MIPTDGNLIKKLASDSLRVELKITKQPIDISWSKRKLI